MTEQDRDKVLHGLDSCGFCDGIPNVCDVTDCPYKEDSPWCTHYLAHDAGVLIGELLKAQKPKALALDEIHRGMAVWLEDVDKADVILAIGGSSGGGCKCFITVDDRSIAPHDCDYGVRWRAWTREPTAEQRRETHWACLRRM